ncbi:MAG: ParB N-terminal domain-containing protein [Deltaproteobacteria bacterium]|nr:ParB N-terminal domain-containing protein [Deltaproteobacteria bacterium]
MDEIYHRLQIIPIADSLVHEGIVEKWVDQIASNVKDQGIMKNPVIVCRKNPYYIVLDGMHRFAALKKLGVRDILACMVDYFSPKIVLEGWDAFLFQPLDLPLLLKELFPEKSGYHYSRVENLAEAKKRVLSRKSLLAVGDTNGSVFALEKKNLDSNELVEELCVANDRIDRILSERDVKVVYTDNSLTLDNFSVSGAQSVVLRPQFTKEEVLARTLHKKIFPPKSTRHLIPERPLRVDLNLSLLMTDIDLKTKNKLLQDHLKWCYENNRVRFYPESVYIFAD